MITWTDISVCKPDVGRLVLMYLDRRGSTRVCTWDIFQEEISHPSHWTYVNLPGEDVSGEILKLSASIMGSRTSDKKREASRRNGKNGGRKSSDR
jgi:hypothetical protein